MPKKVTNKKAEPETGSYLDKIEAEVQANQSKFNLILGGLIILVVGLLVYNYFSKDKPSLGPAQQTENQTSTDVSPDNLPGKYTVKEGDTLFVIAEKYYKDGSKYSELVKANKLSSADDIKAGQVLDIPKLGDQVMIASNSPEASPAETPSITPSPSEAPASPTATTAPQQTDQTTGTQMNTNDWGTPITTNTYTVKEGDWLSTIAARAYNGDILAYKKIASANNISNPDYIQAGMVITIPR